MAKKKKNRNRDRGMPFNPDMDTGVIIWIKAN